MEKISVGNKSAYPYQISPIPNSELEYGITYRQWLIGHIASGVSANVHTNKLIETMADFVLSVTAKADAIIELLDKEQ